MKISAMPTFLAFAVGFLTLRRPSILFAHFLIALLSSRIERKASRLDCRRKQGQDPRVGQGLAGQGQDRRLSEHWDFARTMSFVSCLP
jgi:hypothetical protein